MTSGDTSYSDTNLIVNYLPQTMSDEEFKELFCEMGNIKSCRVIRDRCTGISYGFGFCEFISSEDAHRAIEQLNGHMIDNKSLKVAFARLPGHESKNCNLYIQNVPADLTKQDLESKYAKYGKIINCRVITDPNTGRSKRIGFVLFEQRSSAEQALNMTNNKPWSPSTAADGVLNVRFADDNSKKVHKPDTLMGNGGGMGLMGSGFGGGGFGVHGGGIWQNSMAPHGSGGGPMRNSSMFYGSNTRYNPLMGSGGPGFSPQNNHSLLGGGGGGGGMMRGGDNIGFILYIYNCGTSITNEQLTALFARFGAILKTDVPRDSTGSGKNFGFLTFGDYHCALRAISEMNGYIWQGKPLQVSFKKDKG